MTGKLLQFSGSLLAILALAWLAWRLGLGGDARIASDAAVRRLADEGYHGFEAVETAYDPAGLAALACDPAGRVMVLRRHGSHFAARLLDGRAAARVEDGALIVTTGERRFGDVRLEIGDAAASWAARIERL